MKKIEEMNVEELKAIAYDTLRYVEAYQKQLQTINAEIAKKENTDAVKTEEIEKEKKEKK